MITTVRQAESTEEVCRYRPSGAALELMRHHGPEVILSGPAGTGKTRANLEKLFLVASKYPGCRILMLRKTRASMTDSVLVTWENKVVPRGHPCLRGPTRKFRTSYVFPNGSEIVVGGLDEPTRTFSTEYDIIYVAEAIELTEEEWESLLRALRNGKVPYQQLIGDTNPDSDTHWIYRRAQGGTLRMLESRHEDNPLLWDVHHNRPTEFGAQYLAILDNLTGVRRLRLRFGKWVRAEGVVYEDWDPKVHRILRADLPDGWQGFPRVWDVDFGYRDPFVWHEWALSPDASLYRLREIYRTGRLVTEHCADILAELGYRMEFDSRGNPTGRRIATRENPDPLPKAVVCDHDAEGRATMERHLGLRTIAAYKAITEGVQAVQERLKAEETGVGKRARMYYCYDGLIHPPDEALLAAKLPTCTEDEYGAYVWDTSGGKRKGELPVDKYNHGMDGSRYTVAYVDEIHKRGPGRRFRPL